MSTKVLFLGLDAADPELLERWAKQGHLPAISKLMDVSAHGRTTNPPGLYVGAVWPSFSTSVSPARHTRYCYTQLVPGNYDSKPFLPTDLKAPYFWKALSEAGRKIAVVDVPKVAIEQQSLNGVQIADCGCHDPEYASVQTWPKSAKNKIVGSFGVDLIHDCNGFRESAQEFSDFRDQLLERIDRKTGLIKAIVNQDSWDAVIAVFSESHCVGHQCWHLHDETHPRHDAEVRNRCGNPMLDVYVALDAAVGALLDEVGPETFCVVLASHGIGPHYDASYLLETILERFEQARYGARDGSVGLCKVRPTRVLKALWHRLPPQWRNNWTPARRAAKSIGITPVAGKRYFQIPNNDVFGGVRINLKGREPLGKVAPGPEFDEVCDDLIEDLETLVNAESGRKLVKEVLKTAEVYSGPHIEYLPDLLIEWDRSAPIREIQSPKIHTIQGEYSGCRTGDHKPEGKLFAIGPDGGATRLASEISVMDIGPTIATVLGVALPDVEGKPIEPLFSVSS